MFYEFALAGERDRNYLIEIENDTNKVVSRKLRGYREMWSISNKGNEMVNRSGASHIHAVPQFQGKIPLLDGTVLDCEGLSRQAEGEKYSKSVFGSHYEHAAEVQKKYGNAYLAVFDILFYNGKDIRDIPFLDRHVYVEEIVRLLREHGVGDVISEKLYYENKVGIFDKIVADGGEGVMVKDLRAPYAENQFMWKGQQFRGESMIKVKKVLTRDYYIVGFTPGNGKYKDAVGAIIYGTKQNGVLTPLGKSSGMTDDVRWDMAKNQNLYIGKLAEFGGKDINSDTGVLTHPTFIRLRDDL